MSSSTGARHPGYIYLLCFADTPLKHARHYLGWTRNVDQRLAIHAKGAGSKLMAAVVHAGIHWKVAAVWEGDRHEERRCHRRGPSRLCPICNPRRHV